ncbi:hypothetical protein B9Z65_4888 [Elsinoe australis]|uniref:glycine--tRNA ligase n=1 Tax=Elsinoe australis TaxID=40998 RepID=A0A2P8A6B4_9PEZI|nr:hypothetical protein B9Z65_4888 [Elsinoe australis]
MTEQSDRSFDRKSFEALLKRRFFFTESFEIYRTAANWTGDNGGLYDYGPPGCALQANIVDVWRKHFVLEEDMLELDCTILTPENVFKTSGHVDRFADWMCKDPVTGDYLRADHLVETVLKTRLSDVRLDRPMTEEYKDVVGKIDNFDGSELGKLIKRYDIRNPKGDGEVLPPAPFNLMFKSSIGPSTAAPIYLRPETAQGQFLNFRKLLDYNNNSMPFASASVGKSYRNEISPRAGLLRVREFMMAEIEHFVDPLGGKRHARFSGVQHVELDLLDRDTQLAGQSDVRRVTIGEAVESKTIDNETLGYFLARTYLFLLKVGIDKTRLRFRQHMANEMAHYACDCWDAELLTSYGWIECVGCADRSAYDLEVHSKRTGEKLVVQEALPEPSEVSLWVATLDRKKLGPLFRKDAKLVESAVAVLSQSQLEDLRLRLNVDGVVTIETPPLQGSSNTVTIPSSILSIERTKKIEHVREYIPNVIEPSFGIGRILYSLLEHIYWTRAEDSARDVLSLPVSVAPTKVALLPLSSNALFTPVTSRMSRSLRTIGISSRIDSSSASIGKRYARNDELGTPFAITVDFQSVEDNTVTLRERDSTKQVRASLEEAITAVKNLVDEKETWEAIVQRMQPVKST